MVTSVAVCMVTVYYQPAGKSLMFLSDMTRQCSSVKHPLHYCRTRSFLSFLVWPADTLLIVLLHSEGKEWTFFLPLPLICLLTFDRLSVVICISVCLREGTKAEIYFAVSTQGHRGLHGTIFCPHNKYPDVLIVSLSHRIKFLPCRAARVWFWFWSWKVSHLQMEK